MLRRIVKTIDRIIVLRVSTKGSSKSNENQLQVLKEHKHLPGVPWLLEHYRDELMLPGSAKGRALRAKWQKKYQLQPLYRYGSNDFVGVSLVVEGTRFMLYASTAAKLDEGSSNAFTRTLISYIEEPAFSGLADPEFMRRRDEGDLGEIDHPSLIIAFDVTRVVRIMDAASQIYTAAEKAQAAFDVNSVRVDPAAGEVARMQWTLLAFGSETELMVGRDRRLVGKLNKARAGLWPYRAQVAPLGWTTAQAKSAPLVAVPGEQRAVQALYELGMSASEPAEIAQVLGRDFGVVSRDTKTAGTPLGELRDPRAAGRRMYTLRKLHAYRDHVLVLRFLGVSANRFRPGSGHVLKRRWYGQNAAGEVDTLGRIEYSIPAPAPLVADGAGGTRHGWLPGMSAEQERACWDKLIARRGWDDEKWVEEADTADDLAGVSSEQADAEGHARSGPAGHGDTPIMALSRLCRFRDDAAGEDGPRTFLLSRAPQQSKTTRWRSHGRYELRRELAAPTSDGLDESELIASWQDHDLRGHVADLLTQAVSRVCSEEQTTMLPAQAVDPDAEALDKAKVEGLRARAAALRDDADALAVVAGHACKAGDAADMTRYLAKAKELEKEAAGLLEEAARLDVPAGPTRVDVELGQIRDVVAALRGPYRCGQVPGPLHRALQALLVGGLTFEPGPDALRIWMCASVRVPAVDGSVHHVTARLLVPQAAGRTGRGTRPERAADLTRRFMLEGESVEALAADAQMDPKHVATVVRRTLQRGLPIHGANGAPGPYPAKSSEVSRPLPDPALVNALFAAPVPEPRAVVYTHLTKGPRRKTWSPGYQEAVIAAYVDVPTREESGKGQSRPWALSGGLTGRQDLLTILTSLPAGPDGRRMLAADLAAALGDTRAPRYVTDSSRTIRNSEQTHPPAFRRLPAPGFPEGWYGKEASNVAAENRFVAPLTCPHNDCKEPYATLLVAAPEVLVFGTSLLCRRCKRPAADTAWARRSPFPESYMHWAATQDVRSGAWVPCSARTAGTPCTRDVGAGPGMAWRWDDADPTAPVVHDQTCRAGVAAPSTVRCTLSDCQEDDGAGPGIVVRKLRSTRLAHEPCVRALAAARRRKSA